LLNIVEGKKEAGSQTQDIAGLSRQYSATEPQLTDLTISHNILYLQREARCSKHVSTMSSGQISKLQELFEWLHVVWSISPLSVYQLL